MCQKTVIEYDFSSSEKSSGLVVNFQKYEIFFSKSNPSNVKDNISSLLGFFECLGTEKYLGIPSMIKRKREIYIQLFEG